MMTFRGLMALSAALAAGTSAAAADLVDTGAGTTQGIGQTLVGPATSPVIQQNLAGRFTLGSAAAIGSIEIFMYAYQAGTLTEKIYTNTGGVPGTALYSTDVVIGADPTAAWYGASGLDWALGAGTYWVAFEVSSTSTFFGSANFDPPAPAEAYAFDPGTPPWQVETSSFGFRIGSAVTGEVPEPASWAMMVAGFAMVGAGLRRRRPAVAFA